MRNFSEHDSPDSRNEAVNVVVCSGAYAAPVLSSSLKQTAPFALAIGFNVIGKACVTLGGTLAARQRRYSVSVRMSCGGLGSA